jgi:hypothetical protein
MAMDRIRIGCRKNLTREKSNSGENSDPHPRPQVKF